MDDQIPFDAWGVETTDITARVAAAIGSTPPSLESELLAELRLLRREIAELRSSTVQLQDEVARLRLDSGSRRIVPFAPSEGLVRLS